MMLIGAEIGTRAWAKSLFCGRFSKGVLTLRRRPTINRPDEALPRFVSCPNDGLWRGGRVVKSIRL